MDDSDLENLDVDLTGESVDLSSNNEEPNIITVTPDGGVDANGNPTYVDIVGNPVNADGSPIQAAGPTTITGNVPDVTTLPGLFTKIGSGNFGASDIAKYIAANPGTSAGIMALLAQMMGANQPTTGGYKGSIPNYAATRQQIQYNDPNRRPGAQGRQYFTDVQYGAPADVATAKANAAEQAQGILSGYTPAAPQQSRWNATNAMAMPWNRQAATPTQEPVRAATGRYLQGPTDGMADKINTSIDNRQPAKLSHGEFVVPADVVSHLGNGNSDAGARKLYSMMDNVRQARTGTKKQGRQINPDRYMPGGTVNKYASGGIAQLPVKKFAGTTGSVVPSTDTTTSSTLSPWAGEYVTSMLGKGQALSEQPYQAYTGPLTAGPSDLQQQQFAGISNLAQTGLTPTQFTTGTFDTTQANKYMNPYLTAALQPQMEEMRRQSQINLQPSLAKLTQAGGYGGGRQAIMESEAARNLLSEQNKTLGTGYANAFNKAMEQFNAEQQRGLEAQRAQEAANEASAAFGLKSLDALGTAGATQRGIEQEGLAADKAQFEEQRDYPYKMAQYQQSLLTGLPITTQSNTQNMSPLTQLLATLGLSGNILTQSGLAPAPAKSAGQT